MGLFDAPKTTSTTSPYPGATTALNTGLSDALNLYKRKQLNPAPSISSDTNQGLQSILNSGLRSAAPLNQSLQRFSQMAGGSGDISSSMQSAIANRALGPSMSEQNLSGIAHGDLIGQGDPNYDRLRQRAMENASTEAGMQASGLGRTGSDFHQTAVARQVGDTVAGMDYQRLQDERARQVEANSLIDQQRQAGYGMGLNAQNSASAIQAGNQDRRFSANSAVPGAATATMLPGQTQLGVGRQLDDIRNQRQGVPGTNLSSLMQILGIASPYGNKTTTEPSNEAGGYAGLGLGLASLLFGK